MPTVCESQPVRYLCLCSKIENKTLQDRLTEKHGRADPGPDQEAEHGTRYMPPTIRSFRATNYGSWQPLTVAISAVGLR